MLKVEKQKGIVNLMSEKKEPSSYFFWALAWALAIHCSALILFQISPLNILGSNIQQPFPSTVTTEWKEQATSSLSQSPQELTLTPPPRRPLFEKGVPTPLAARMTVLPWEKWFQNEMHTFLDQTFIKELNTVVSGIDLIVSGDLAERVYEWKMPPKEIPKSLKSYPSMAKFEVEVHEQTGEIFRKRFMEGDQDLGKIANEWLDLLLFTPQEGKFSSKSEVLWIVGPP